MRRPALDILTYHAVVATEAPLNDWCFLSFDRFRAQMDAIRASRRPVLPLVEAVDRLAKGEFDRSALVLTFDDGFLDNVERALPLLQQHGFPATIFLTTGVIGSQRTLWPSRLIRALMETKLATVTYGGETLSLSDHKSRCRSSARLQALIKVHHPDNPSAAVAEIEQQLNMPQDAPVPRNSPFAMVDPADIARALDSGLIEFGAHTVTHPLLSALTDDEIGAEVAGSIDAVERLTGRPCRSFAYPNGRVQDFDARSVDVLAKRGLKAAVTTVQGPNLHANDRFRLARWGISTHHPATEFWATLAGLHPTQIRARLR